uniref:Protein kinase domain-containing protein n=1 Tax=Ditylum brightwellii TaxID=49249 RepID=A0A6S9J152_9STRA|mmetsp:Transcript_6536/g.9683  ORF Transcript_6536/g.9683 Transcript_6536/m.9683 type:complete len:461 (+) Transcript_6536:168-1550(+)
MSSEKEENTVDTFPCSVHDSVSRHVDCVKIPDEINGTFHTHSTRIDAPSSNPWLHAANSCKRSVEKLVASSKLFNKDDDKDEKDFMALFDMNEIDLGQFLGKGQFSNVYAIESLRVQPLSEEKEKEDLLSPEEHARKFLAENVKRKYTNKSRYAIKFLREDLSRDPDLIVTAVHDLVLEAQFLSALEHPNIIRIRGWGAAGADGFIAGKNKGYFLVLDCLDETLETRIRKWAKENKQYKPNLLDSFRKKISPESEKLFADRLKVAHDITAAMTYLHKQNVIYRDLKPENLGFDVRGDIKLFDFGLAKEVPSDIDMNEDLYMMSGAGSLRYMAPEVVLGKPYNLKADVYSASLLLWEILALKIPYDGFTANKLVQDVVMKGNRPKLNSKWPSAIVDIIDMGWDNDISERPTMEIMHNVVRYNLTTKYDIALGGAKKPLKRRSMGSIGTVRSAFAAPRAASI